VEARLRAVVQAEHGAHEVRERVVAKVGRDVGDAQALGRRQRPRRRVRQRRQPQPRGRGQAELGVPAPCVGVSAQRP